MGCFLRCFGNSKRQERRKSGLKSLPRNQVIDEKYSIADLSVEFSKKLESEEKPVKSSSKLKHEGVEDLKSVDGRKKVTFDLNVKAHEDLPTEEAFDDLPAQKEEKQTKEGLLSANVSSKLPLSRNHRYKNCTDIDDGCDDDIEDGEGDMDDASTDYNTDLRNKHAVVEEESSESLFSLSIDSRKRVSAAETGEKEVNSPMPGMQCNKKELKLTDIDQNARLRNGYADTVLTPVENISRWKAIKTRVPIPLPKDQAKENTSIEQNDSVPTCLGMEPGFKISNQVLGLNFNSNMPFGQETAVDTSLSSWLVESETSPKSKESTPSVGNTPRKRVNTPKGDQDRPILGVLTVEDLRQFSASAASPRRSRGRSPSPEETPIIGTVGSYWSHTGRSASSGSPPSSGERMKKNIRSQKEGEGGDMRCITALEARLDGAL